MRRSCSVAVAVVALASAATAFAQTADRSPSTESPDAVVGGATGDKPPRAARRRTAARTVPAQEAEAGAAHTVTALPPAKPEKLGGAPDTASPAEPPPVRSLFGALGDPAPQTAGGGATPTNPLQSLFGAILPQPRREPLPSVATRGQIDALIAHHARLNGVPEALVHRIVIRESKYNPRAVGRGGAMGLMQIKTATARGVGYAGGPAGLLDAETNLTYGVKYLAGAWRVSGGSHDRAVSHYARGYYYAAKRMNGGKRDAEPMHAGAPEKPASLFSLFTTADAGR